MLSLCTFIMGGLRQAASPLSKSNSPPEAPKHAEIQRLKEGTINIIMDSPRHSYLCIQSKDLFNQEYKKLFLLLFGNNRGYEFLGGNYN